jgi:hypothetical protein
MKQQQQKELTSLHCCCVIICTAWQITGASTPDVCMLILFLPTNKTKQYETTETRDSEITALLGEILWCKPCKVKDSPSSSSSSSCKCLITHQSEDENCSTTTSSTNTYTV